MSKTKKDYICIACPLGCHLTLEAAPGGDLTVTGNKCRRGVDYATAEFLAPKRMVTATCRPEREDSPRVPVKTDSALPKELIEALLSELYALDIRLPVRRGDQVITDYRGTGINVVVTRALD